MNPSTERTRHGLVFRKSSYSGSGQSGCIEVAAGGEGFCVGDTKDPAGPILTFDADSWTAFIVGVKTDRP